jgi:hypothetical protein
MNNIIKTEPIVPKYVIRKFERKFGKLESMLFRSELTNIIIDDITNMSKMQAMLKRRSSENKDIRISIDASSSGSP